MFLSNTSISSGYSTDSILPSFEDQDEKVWTPLEDEAQWITIWFFQIDNFQFSQYEAEKIMEQDEEMDERMMTMLRYKMQYKESLEETK